MELVFAEDDDAAGDLVGGFEGLFEAEAAVAEFDAEAGAAEFAGESEGGGVEALAERLHVSRRQWRDACIWPVGRASRGLQSQDEPVFAHGEADAGGFGAADGFAEAVVAAAAEEGVLRAEAAVGELEGGAGVVVEAADQAVIARVGNAGGVEGGEDGGEVGLWMRRRGSRRSSAARR